MSSFAEATLAHEQGLLDLNALIKIAPSKRSKKCVETTYGRLIFNNQLPKNFDFVNEKLNKSALSKIIASIIEKFGVNQASICLDNIKNIGFEYATISGITWGMDDLMVPKEKPQIIKEAQKEAVTVSEEFRQGLLTNEERENRIISIWDKAGKQIENIIPKTFHPDNPVFMIIDSRARGSWSAATQMMGMKGLVQNPQGNIIELPVQSSYKEGFDVLEYFISIHGARKGQADTALRTAEAGYLTRRLIDVAQDVIIREEDCQTQEGIEILKKEGEEYGYPFAERLYSRTALENIKVKNKIIVKAGEIINRETAEIIDKAKAESIKVRSPITCKTLYGVCSKCYGLDLGNNQPIKLGESVGIIAAQSIGEPGTQLTLRTFHSGGIAGVDITHGLPRVEEVFEARPPRGKAILAETDGIIESIQENNLIKIIKIKNLNPKTKKAQYFEYPIPRTTILLAKIGDKVLKGQQISEGSINLKELLATRDSREVERYVINEIQKIYIPEGASINDKHIEVIVRQMFSRVIIKEEGDTDFIVGDIIEKSKLLEDNRQAKKLKGAPAKAQLLLMGITQVSLSTESFLSAASFQETSRVLVGAAISAKVDKLRGLKENVIIGRLIPAGIGWRGIPVKAITDEEEKEEIEEGAKTD